MARLVQLLLEVGERVVGVAEPLGKHLHEAPEELYCDERVLAHEPEQALAIEADGARLLDGDDGGAAGRLIDEAHLPEVPSGVELCDGHAALRHFDRPAEEDEKLVARVTFLDDGLTLAELPSPRDAE